MATVYTHFTAFHIPFMRLLQSWGYEVHAAASPVQGRKREVAAAGVVCRDVPFVRVFPSFGHLRALQTLVGFFRREHYALIHVHTPAAAWLGRLAARLCRQGPVLYTAHGFHFYRGAPASYWLLYYPLERMAARWTAGLVVMNKEDYRAGQCLGFVPGENLFLVHGVGVDLARYGKAAPASSRDLGLPPDARVVACVAELTANKNHRLLLDAWRLVSRRLSRAVLLIVGEGALRNKVAGWIREMEASVKLLGFRHDVPNLLALAEAVVLPSRREGLPRVVMEAMAAGKPVVATDVRGSRDLIKHGENGYLVPLNDPKTLATRLIELLENPDLARRMGIRGRELAKHFTMENVLQEMRGIYKKFL